MRENFDHLKNYERIKVPRKIDEPTTFIFGLTINELAIFAVVTLVFCLSSRGTPFAILGIPLGGSCAFLARNYRNKVIPGFTQHFMWGYGINLTHINSPIPGDFLKYGTRRYGP